MRGGDRLCRLAHRGALIERRLHAAHRLGPIAGSRLGEALELRYDALEPFKLPRRLLYAGDAHAEFDLVLAHRGEVLICRIRRAAADAPG